MTGKTGVFEDAGALADQLPAAAGERGPQAPATLAARRPWPTAWIEALAGFFREPRTPQARAAPEPR
ncbi:MAG: hypothetical protein GEU89_03365 [Kiloniellaceae bacterium]|nr:hypothetical protein [Kiloniellaceae bacterium]